MKKEKRIKFQIEKLKDEKENLKFGHSVYSNAWLVTIIFLATVTITLINNLEEISSKIIALVILLILILISNQAFKFAIKDRMDKLNDKAKKIDNLYNKLLK